MASGDVLAAYDASSNLTVTALASLAASSSHMAGWTSAGITTSGKRQLISGQITVGASPTAGEIRMYAYCRMSDSAWPDLFSAGTEGSEGAATINDSSGVRDAGMYPVWFAATDADASRVYPIAQFDLGAKLGFEPAEYALFITHSTVQALASSGQQVTVKATYHNVTP